MRSKHVKHENRNEQAWNKMNKAMEENGLELT
jgi:hypothetical protein